MAGIGLTGGPPGRGRRPCCAACSCASDLKCPRTQPLLEIPLVALRPGNRVWLVRDQQLAVVPVEVAQTVDDRVLLFSTGADVREGDALGRLAAIAGRRMG